MKLAVVIAAYNEEKHIGQVVHQALVALDADIIVVDDGSKDRTAERARGATVLRHIVNLGKGAAMKTGADYAFANAADAVIFMDADGQHHPDELSKFADALKKGYAIVFGYRKRNTHMPFILQFGNWFISSVIRGLYGMDLHDSQCGYRALTRAAYKKVRWTARDYSVESEMIALSGKQHLRYIEVPIATIYHDKYKGTTPLDGFPIVWNLLWWRLR